MPESAHLTVSAWTPSSGVRAGALIPSRRNIRRAVILTITPLLVCTSLLVCTPAFADETPEEMLKALIAQVRTSGSPAPILERVDWKTAFAQTLPEHREAIGAKTPKELKKIYRAVFENPNKLMKEKIAPKMGTLSPEKQAAIEVLMMRVESTMKERKKSDMEILRRSEIKVVGSKIDGDKATVEFESLLDGKTKTQMLQLIKVDGQWRFPTLQWVKAQEKTVLPAVPKTN
jgi:hypothetical protein